MREHVVRHAPFSCYYVARMKLNRNIVEGYHIIIVGNTLQQGCYMV